MAGVDLELLDLLDQVGYPVLGLAHEHGGGERHAALAGGAERRAHYLIERVLLVRVGHHHAVVLGAHVRLHTLAVLRATLVNVRALYKCSCIHRLQRKKKKGSTQMICLLTAWSEPTNEMALMVGWSHKKLTACEKETKVKPNDDDEVVGCW